MKPKKKLSKSMTLTQFDNGYWYANELQEFAETIGIPFASKLRKDELEKAIKFFLNTGRAQELSFMGENAIVETEMTAVGATLCLSRMNKYENHDACNAFFPPGLPRVCLRWPERESTCTNQNGKCRRPKAE